MSQCILSTVHDGGCSWRQSMVTKTAGMSTACDWRSVNVRAPAQGGPPLPASLTALRFDSKHVLTLTEMRLGNSRFRAAAGPVLTVRAPAVILRTAWPHGRPEPPELGSASTPRRQLISKLPAGFTALELHAQCFSITATARTEILTLADAARELCHYFAAAPASFRRFSLCWAGDRPLRACVKGSLVAMQPCEPECSQELLKFHSVDVLAEHMQDYAIDHGLSVATAEQPLTGVVVVRL